MASIQAALMCGYVRVLTRELLALSAMTVRTPNDGVGREGVGYLTAETCPLDPLGFTFGLQFSVTLRGASFLRFFHVPAARKVGP